MLFVTKLILELMIISSSSGLFYKTLQSDSCIQNGLFPIPMGSPNKGKGMALNHTSMYDETIHVI